MEACLSYNAIVVAPGASFAHTGARHCALRHTASRRLRGFGRWRLFLKLPNPLTLPSPLRGEGDHGRRPVVTFLLTYVSI